MLFAFIRRFYSLKVFKNPFTQQRSDLFKVLIRQISTLVNDDDIILVSSSKSHMPHSIKELHDFVKKGNLYKAPEKWFFMLLTVKNLDHDFGFTTFKPI